MKKRVKPVQDKPMRKKRKGSYALNPVKITGVDMYRAYWKTPHGELRTVPMSKRDAEEWAESKGGYVKPVTRSRKQIEAARKIAKNPKKKDVTHRAILKHVSSDAAMISKVSRTLARFNNIKPDAITKKTVDIPAPRGVGLRIGTLLAVAYDTGARKFVHRFKTTSQPVLVASGDGKQLLIVGGRYRFTDRGIVDF